MKSSDPDTQHAIEVSSQWTVQLLTISKFELGKPSASANPSFVCLSEKLPDTAATITSADYVGLVADGLKRSSIPLTVVKEPHPETVDGVEFSAIEVHGKVAQTEILQKYYAQITKGYALVFITTSYSDDDRKKITEIMASVKMRHP